MKFTLQNKRLFLKLLPQMSVRQTLVNNILVFALTVAFLLKEKTNKCTSQLK